MTPYEQAQKLRNSLKQALPRAVRTIKKKERPKNLDFLNRYGVTNRFVRSPIQRSQVKEVEKKVWLGEPGKKGDRGEKGDPGKPGKDGNTPVKGKDYFTQSEIESFYADLKQRILSEIPEQEKIELPEPLQIDQEFAKKIVQLIHSLPENDKLEVSKGIRNYQSFVYKGTRYGMEEMMHGGGSSSGSSTPLTPTGTVNASNTIFGVVSQPSSVIADGITYFEGHGYSYAGLSITMDIAPSQYIRYYA